jgi:hypothetical protein
MWAQGSENVRLPSDFGRTLVVFPNKSLDLKLTMNAGYKGYFNFRKLLN